MNNIPKCLTQSDFQAIADFCYRRTSRLVRKGRPVAPVLLAGSIDNGNVTIVSELEIPAIENEVRKIAITATMSAHVQRDDVDFVVFITEVWVRLNPSLPLQGPVADDPQRTEAVVFSIMSKECQTAVINPLHRHPSRLERGSVDFAMKIAGLMVREPETRN